MNTTAKQLNFNNFQAPIHMQGEIAEENYWYVVANDTTEQQDLVVAKFGYDGGHVEAAYYQEQAKLMAELFVTLMNIATK